MVFGERRLLEVVEDLVLIARELLGVGPLDLLLLHLQVRRVEAVLYLPAVLEALQVRDALAHRVVSRLGVRIVHVAARVDLLDVVVAAVTLVVLLVVEGHVLLLLPVLLWQVVPWRPPSADTFLMEL